MAEYYKLLPRAVFNASNYREFSFLFWVLFTFVFASVGRRHSKHVDG